jgi:uncharacterized membrane protein YhhN
MSKGKGIFGMTISAHQRYLLGLMAVAAIAAICGSYGMPGRWLLYVAKPLATLCAVGIAMLADGAKSYRRAILFGLWISTLGDVLLMLPGDLFAAGLGAFLAAHVAYLSAFIPQARLGSRLSPFLAYAGLAAVLVTALWPGVPVGLRGAILVYTLALAAMAAQALARASLWRTTAAWLAALGGAVFVISDATLAINRFRWPFAAAEFVILATYWLAQAMIALSVVATHLPRQEATRAT